IDPTIQNNIFTNGYKFIFPEQITYDACKEVLEKLSEIYRWEEFENKNFLGKKNRMGYFATLMIDWINTKPLNVIIKSVIRYYSQHKLSITLDFNKSYQTFDQENSIHLNYIVNQVMRDLETVVRFSIRNYVTNYLQLTNQNESLWRDYLDYGTSQKLVVELQKIGIERQIAIELYNKADEYFILNEANELTSIQEEVINHEKLTDEAKEVMKSVIEEIGR
ncbi:TPA: DEAD/DEAH box helicase, partial [Streptococcus suis]|nr:DEAD/DEAH box helicase [Streptococcus suis]HEM3718315.1 DEAD/DEAH box helicase [Streptococcus suis]